MATKPATRRYSVKKSTGHFSTVAQKQRAHDAYVKAYAEFGTRRKACEKVGINYNLGVEWEKSGYVSQEELDIASAEYLDTLLDTAHDRAVTGITVNTKDKHGNVYSHAVFNDRVLLRLIEARDKRYQQRQSSTEYNITVNTPAQHIYGSLMGFDTSALNRGVENGGIPMEVFQKFKTEIAPYFEGIMFEEGVS